MQAIGSCRTGSIVSSSTANPICWIPSRAVSPFPVESLDDFFAFLVDLNKQVEPDRTPAVVVRRPAKVRRLTAENPLDAVIARLQQFTSVTLARKLVERRAETESCALTSDEIAAKATGVAYSTRSALDYVVSTPRDPLNRRVLGLYYGAMALAQAEMLASPAGPIDLDKVEAMTLDGHGIYTKAVPDGGFADLRVGVLASGFFSAVDELPEARHLRLSEEEAKIGVRSRKGTCWHGLPASRPVRMHARDRRPLRRNLRRTAWMDLSRLRPGSQRAEACPGSEQHLWLVSRLVGGRFSVESLNRAGWPLAEIRQETEGEGTGTVFRARVDHAGHDNMWPVLPTHSSPFGNSPALLFPTMGGLREYRTIAAVTLYALSVMARYMPGAWRRIEGGDQDHYLALVQASLAVWERLLPEHFLESIAGENRAHCATWELVGVSSGAVRIIRFPYGQFTASRRVPCLQPVQHLPGDRLALYCKGYRSRVI